MADLTSAMMENYREDGVYQHGGDVKKSSNKKAQKRSIEGWEHPFRLFDPEQARDEKGMWTSEGAGASVDTREPKGQDRVQVETGHTNLPGLAGLLQKQGGFTWEAAAGKAVTGKAMIVSPYPERSKVFTTTPSPNELAKYIAENADLILTKDHFLGGWLDSETGKTYLDVSIAVTSHEEARQIALDNDQLAYYDLDKQETVYVNREAKSGQRITALDDWERPGYGEHHGEEDRNGVDGTERRRVRGSLREADGQEADPGRDGRGPQDSGGLPSQAGRAVADWETPFTRDAKWNEEAHPRGKTTESSNEGSFAPGDGGPVGPKELPAPRAGFEHINNWDKVALARLDQERQDGIQAVRDIIAQHTAQSWDDLSQEVQTEVALQWGQGVIASGKEMGNNMTDAEVDEQWVTLSNDEKLDMAKAYGKVGGEFTTTAPSSEEDTPSPPDSWDTLPDDKQEDVKNAWMQSNHDAFLEQEAESLAQNGEHFGLAAGNFNDGNGVGMEQQNEAVQSALEEAGMTMQAANEIAQKLGTTGLSVQVDNSVYEQQGYMNKGDLKGDVTMDPSILAQVADPESWLPADKVDLSEGEKWPPITPEDFSPVDPKQGDLPGVGGNVGPGYSAAAAALANQLEGKIGDKAVETVIDKADDINLEEYVDKDSLEETKDMIWDEKSDKEKFGIAKNELDDAVFHPDVPEPETTVMGLSVPAQVSLFDQNENSRAYQQTREFGNAMQIARTEQLLKERGIEGISASQVAQATWSDWKGSSTSEIGMALQVATAEELGTRFRNPGAPELRAAERGFQSIGEHGDFGSDKWANWSDLTGNQQDAIKAMWVSTASHGPMASGESSEDLAAKFDAKSIADKEKSTWLIKNDLSVNQITKGRAEYESAQARASAVGRAALQAYARATWDTTQYLLDKAGVKEMDVYRAYKFPKSDLTGERVLTYGRDPSYHYGEGPLSDPGQAIPYKQLPDAMIARNGAQSASLVLDTVNNWQGVGVGKHAPEGFERVVVRARVPAEAILSLPVYGQNYHSEQEVVLTGGPWKTWDAWVGKAPPVQGLAGQHGERAQFDMDHPRGPDGRFIANEKGDAEPTESQYGVSTTGTVVGTEASWLNATQGQKGAAYKNFIKDAGPNATSITDLDYKWNYGMTNEEKAGYLTTSAPTEPATKDEFAEEHASQLKYALANSNHLDEMSVTTTYGAWSAASNEQKLAAFNQAGAIGAPHSASMSDWEANVGSKDKLKLLALANDKQAAVDTAVGNAAGAWGDTATAATWGNAAEEAKSSAFEKYSAENSSQAQMTIENMWDAKPDAEKALWLAPAAKLDANELVYVKAAPAELDAGYKAFKDATGNDHEAWDHLSDGTKGAWVAASKPLASTTEAEYNAGKKTFEASAFPAGSLHGEWDSLSDWNKQAWVDQAKKFEVEAGKQAYLNDPSGGSDWESLTASGKKDWIDKAQQTAADAQHWADKQAAESAGKAAWEAQQQQLEGTAKGWEFLSDSTKAKWIAKAKSGK